MRLLAEVCVYTYIESTAVQAGRFSVTGGHGTFRYDPDYLAHPGAFALDPINLPLSERVFSRQADGGYFGVLLDCCAQEWGQRILHLLAQDIGADMRADVLSQGVGDPHHLLVLGSGYGAGSLRFSHLPFMTATDLEPSAVDCEIGDLGRVQRLAALMARVEGNEPLTVDERAMLVAGVSLGGSRPKALVSHRGAEWIAKFHRAAETVDIQRVELAVNHLALACGINVAPSAAHAYDLGGVERTIFLSRRFDRSATGAPMHYVSACSLLGAPRTTHAGAGGGPNLANSQAQFSYMDVAHMIRRISVDPTTDLRELFLRMAFNAAVGNRDDHLCNHGFLLDEATGRYRLSPAFDLALTPNPPAFHPIALGREGRVPSVANVLSCCGEFGMRRGDALAVVDRVAEGLSKWREIAAMCELSQTDRRWAETVGMREFSDQVRPHRPNSKDIVPAVTESETNAPTL